MRPPPPYEESPRFFFIFYFSFDYSITNLLFVETKASGEEVSSVLLRANLVQDVLDQTVLLALFPSIHHKPLNFLWNFLILFYAYLIRFVEQSHQLHFG